jgi:hypothetical protein
MLKHPWLNMTSGYDYVMNENEFQRMMLRNRLAGDTKEEGT